MSDRVVKVLDEDDLKFVDVLHSLGFRRNVAKVITYLAVVGEAKSWDIERGSSMTVPN
jgi:predicted transcriptional regulator